MDPKSAAAYADRLKACTSSKQWDEVCDDCKRANGGQYPDDWYEVVLASGLARRTLTIFGADPEIRIVALR